MVFESLISSRDGVIQVNGNYVENLLGFEEQDDSPKLTFRSTSIDVKNGINKIGEGPYDTYICLLITRGAGGTRVKFLNRKLALKPREALRTLIKYMRCTLPGGERFRKKDLLITHGGPQLYWTGIAEEHVLITVGAKKRGENYPNTYSGFLDFQYREDLSKRPATCTLQ